MFLRPAHILKICTYFIFICAFLGLSLLVYSPIVQAADNPIQVKSRSSSLIFPKAIDFKIGVHDSSSSLVQATIYLTYEGFGYQESHRVNATASALTYTFEWRDDLAANDDHFPPVGTQIRYYWTITDTAGNSYTDPAQTVAVVDNRFNWQHLSKGLYQVSWYNRGTDFGQMVLGKVETTIGGISHNLGGGLQHPISLWVYANANDFQGSLPPNVHEWVGGIAFPAVFEASIVAQSADDDTLQRDMPHELTHLIFHQLIAPGIVPTWFDEGLAVYNQNFHESDMLVRFRTALYDHNLLRLNSIAQSFPADADKAYLAYAQSWQLVDYMYQTFGLQKMNMLIHNMDNPNQSFDEDMRQALGVDVAHLENQWHISLNQPLTLSKDQQLEPLTITIPISNPYNGTTLALLLLGIVLVLVSSLGLGSIIVYQRKIRQKNLLECKIQYNPQSSVLDRKGSVHWSQHAVYTNPGSYISPERK